jgi:hypothetical protein
VSYLLLAAAGWALGAALVLIGALTQIAALSMPGVGLAMLSTLPLLVGIARLILPDARSDDPSDGVLEP